MKFTKLKNQKMIIINIFLLVFVLILLIYNIYQINFISSSRVSISKLNKEILDINEEISQLQDLSKLPSNFTQIVKDDFGMVELEKFDYIIIGPAEFVFTQTKTTAY